MDTTMQPYSDMQILGVLAITTLFFVVISYFIFKAGERRARESGKFDEQTWY
jgi:hypothetical protein